MIFNIFLIRRKNFSNNADSLKLVIEMSEDDKDSGEKANDYHEYYKGKISTELKVPVEKLEDFSIWYTPGVAEPSKKISENKDKVFEYTNRSNSIAVISDGSR